ncbi:uncharacterized protein [Clytia hemisphaerica]|uniref:Uncharacterized protein n=1 Tax=Clytia hemisphaerica TaxID=252671 RepID=A0A7M5V1N8_9CNID
MGQRKFVNNFVKKNQIINDTMRYLCINLFFCIVYIGTLILSVLGSNSPFTPAVRYHGPHQNASLNYSYINIKYLKNQKLNVVPFAVFNLLNRTSCVKECVKTHGVCKSLNVKKINGGFNCEILDTDKYSEVDGALIADSETTHYVIANQCFKNPCDGGCSRCKPIYHNNSFHCEQIYCSCKEVTSKRLPSGYYNLKFGNISAKGFCDTQTDGGNWLMIGNYSIFEDDVSTNITYGNVDQFAQLQTGDFLLDKTHLAEINAYQPINEIWFYCYRPIHGRTVSLVTSLLPIGIEYRDSLVMMNSWINNAYGTDFPTAFRALSEDNSKLSVEATKSKGDLYNHAFYLPFMYHFVITRQRNNCDDYVNMKIGNWRLYIR